MIVDAFLYEVDIRPHFNNVRTNIFFAIRPHFFKSTDEYFFSYSSALFQPLTLRVKKNNNFNLSALFGVDLKDDKTFAFFYFSFSSILQ